MNNRKNVYACIPNWMMFFNEADVFRFEYDLTFLPIRKIIAFQIAFANEKQ